MTKWIVASPFFRPEAEGPWQWIDDFVEDRSLEFEKVGRPPAAMADQWHSRTHRGTALKGWLGHWRQMTMARRRAGRDAGMITVFPQLALLAAVRKRLSLGRRPLVAWCFNIGAPPGRLSRIVGRWAFAAADHIVVHSSRELTLVHDWFGVPTDKVSFVPLQKSDESVAPAEDTEAPFILAMGSANRDYATLAKAVEGTGIPLTIVAAERCVAGIDLPPEVSHRANLTPEQCLDLAARARISIIPLADVDAASGQVTIIEAMRIGRPVIATKSPGVDDYVTDGVTGMLVPAGDVQALRDTIADLWHNHDRRSAIAERARTYSAEYFSDEAAARALEALLLALDRQ